MDPSSSGMDQDPLTGSPELFATNLLIARGIEHELDSIEIENEQGTVTVHLHSEGEDPDPETLTEKPDAWKKIVDRFRSMTEFNDDSSNEGVLQPKTPLTSEVEEIRINYSGPNRILLDFRYPG